MHKPELILEKQTEKNIWDFEIPMDQLIPVSSANQMLFSKKKIICLRVDH